jgi:hypothetical protein
MVLDPEGTRLTAVFGDFDVYTWDAFDGEQLCQVTTHDWILSALYDPTGDRLILLTGWGYLRVIESNSCEEIARVGAHERYITSATFSPDGTRGASASADQTVHIWDMVPYRVRYEERQAILAAQPEADSIVDALWQQAHDWHTVAVAVREDNALSEPVRRAALNEILRRATKQQ